MNSEEVRLIAGDLVVDDRGIVRFVNDFDFAGVKRFYIIENHSPGFVRAWHAHRKEAKYFTVVQGAMLICAVRIDDWDHPSAQLPVERFVLSDVRPSILYIPPGFANGIMSLTEHAKLVVFSTLSLKESLADDIRFPARYWDPWHVEER
jgi:dTDP-4-dehydrorhamnose 3,5-epimerase